MLEMFKGRARPAASIGTDASQNGRAAR
jgi:hypothetical protein